MTFLQSVWFAAVLGIVAALLFPLISFVASGSAIKGLLIGADGKLSTSKCQFWIWTEIVLFAYVFLYTSHVQGGHDWSAAAPRLPTDILILMGLSVVTATTAKAIASSSPSAAQTSQAVTAAAGGSKTTMAAIVKRAGYAGLVTGNQDSTVSSFSKIQMLTWTVVAACVYVFAALSARSAFFDGTAQSYPDVDAALVVLVGLGHGAYLGNKIASKGGTDV